MADAMKKLSELQWGMQGIQVTAVIIRKFETCGGAGMRLAVIADETGSFLLGVHAQQAKNFRVGDVIFVSFAFVSYFRGALVLALSRKSHFIRVSRFDFVFAPTPNYSFPLV